MSYEERYYCLTVVPAMRREIESLTQCNELEIARNTQLGALPLLEFPVFEVMSLFLLQQCPTIEQMQAVGILDANSEEQPGYFSFVKALRLSEMCGTRFFSNGLQHVAVGNDHWADFLLRMRARDPMTAVRLMLGNADIPVHIEEALFEKKDDEELGIVFHSAMNAIHSHQTSDLRNLKRRMPPHIFERQVCARFDGKLPLTYAIREFARIHMPLDFELLKLLVPSKAATCVPLNATLFAKEVNASFHGNDEAIFAKSREVIEDLTGFGFEGNNLEELGDVFARGGVNDAFCAGQIGSQSQQFETGSQLFTTLLFAIFLVMATNWIFAKT